MCASYKLNCYDCRSSDTQISRHTDAATDASAVVGSYSAVTAARRRLSLVRSTAIDVVELFPPAQKSSCAGAADSVMMSSSSAVRGGVSSEGSRRKASITRQKATAEKDATDNDVSPITAEIMHEQATAEGIAQKNGNC